MLVRNCAGGVVFHGDRVLVLKNEKGEWVFPKGVVRNGDYPDDVAVARVNAEAGVRAHIVATAGRTNYEFFSVSRQRPVANKITWYIMRADSDEVAPNPDQQFFEGAFLPVDEAMERITYSQDKSLLMLSYQKFKECQ